MKRKLAILFPGRNYSADQPLLHFADRVLALKGYERIALTYDRHCKGFDRPISGLIESSKQEVINELQEIHAAEYDEIVMVSKSMGTVLAGWSAQELALSVRHIFLTPLEDTLCYMLKGSCIVAAGRKDRFLPTEILEAYCKEHEIPLYEYAGVGHSMEDAKDIKHSLKVLESVVGLYEEFL